MSNLISYLDKDPATEPALKVGSITATVAGVLSVVTYFFPNLNPDVVQLLFVIISVALPLITSIFVRGQVWSPASVKEVVEESVHRAEEATKNKYKPKVRRPGEDPPFVSGITG